MLGGESQVGSWTEEGEPAYQDRGREARGKAEASDKGEDPGGKPEMGTARPTGLGSAAKE